MRYDLFVSCASRNIPLAKPFLEELLQQIEQRSDLTWYFYDEPRRIGDEWATEAAAALRSASVFLPVYSPHYFKSDICRRSTSPSCGVSTRPVSGVVAWCRSGGCRPRGN